MEFVLILPIFLFILFACIDFGKIFYTENNLESRMDDTISMYQNEKNKEEIIKSLELQKEDISLSIEKKGKYTTFALEKETTIITPGLNLLLGNPYKAKITRVISNE